MTTTLITGGAGFVGSALANALIAQGNPVIVVDNLSAGKKSFLNNSPLLTFVEADIRDRVQMETVFRTHAPSVVYHLAAIHYIPFCNEHPLETYETNVWGTKVLLDAASAFQPQTFFFMSTAAIYDQASVLQHEDLPQRPSDVYGITKVLGEELVQAYARTTGVQAVIGRLFNVFGPNETSPHLVPVILDRVLAGERTIALGNIHTKRDYIFVDDVVAAVQKLVSVHDKSESLVANIGTGATYTAEEIVDTIAKILGEKINIQIDEKRKRASDRPVLCADTTRITTRTGWRAEVSLKSGLQKLLAAAPPRP